MSCTRLHVVRNQKSSGRRGSGDGIVNGNAIGHRQHRFSLQKQFSLDQGQNGRSFICQRAISMDIGPKDYCGNSEDILPEASLQVFNTFNAKPLANGNNETPTRVSHSSGKKTNKRHDERLNINIFLGQNINVPELDLPSDSDDEKNKNVGDSTIAPKATTKNSAQNRRQQFNSQRSASVSDGRPKLTRAMSAPIRPITDQPKKGFRRKKIVPSDPTPIQIGHYQPPPMFPQQYRQRLFGEKRDERPSTCRPKIKVSKVPPQPPRLRSSINGCDIVTLVSLLSPGGSDSEKEEHSIKGDVASTERSGGPSLRKLGKSVSFQESDISEANDPNTIDLSMVNIRRASLVPLAAKIRMNRPPTAPPGSIFARNALSGNDMTSSKDLFSDEKHQVSTKLVVQDKIQGDSDTFGADNTFPEYVRSFKEKECWILFQKMVNKGISVSYETILRGMLTPTEVRAAEKKQKEIFERQASLDLESADTPTTQEESCAKE